MMAKFRGIRNKAEIEARITEIEALRTKHRATISAALDDRLIGVVEALRWILVQANHIEGWAKQVEEKERGKF